MLRILLYELDRQLNQDYRRALTSAGFTVRSANSGAEIGEILTADGGDFLITELEPGDTGLEIIKTLRQSDFYIPIIVVTDRDDFNDMKKAFEAGADDYMTKPARMEEMILRIRAVMRRAGQLNGDRHSLGKTTVNYSSMKVETPEGTVILPQKEFLLLYKLLSYPGKIFTRIQLMDEIWGADSDTGWETVTVHIGRLRKRFEGWREFGIESVRGLGYKAVKKV